MCWCPGGLHVSFYALPLSLPLCLLSSKISKVAVRLVEQTGFKKCQIHEAKRAEDAKQVILLLWKFRIVDVVMEQGSVVMLR